PVDKRRGQPAPGWHARGPGESALCAAGTDRLVLVSRLGPLAALAGASGPAGAEGGRLPVCGLPGLSDPGRFAAYLTSSFAFVPMDEPLDRGVRTTIARAVRSVTARAAQAAPARIAKGPWHLR